MTMKSRQPAKKTGMTHTHLSEPCRLLSILVLATHLWTFLLQHFFRLWQSHEAHKLGLCRPDANSAIISAVAIL